MGNKISYEVNFQQVCNHYMNLIKYANKNEYLVKNSELLKEVAERYIKYEGNIDSFDSEISDLGWMACVHKLHPLIYKNTAISVDWLVNASIRQGDFCIKILPYLDNYNLDKWKNEYTQFLK